MKIHSTITIDEDTWISAQKQYKSVSGRINELLKMDLARNSKNVNALNLEIQKKKREELRQKLLEFQMNFDALDKNIAFEEEKIGKMEQEKLEKEKDRLEKERHCGICAAEIEVPLENKGTKYNLCMDCFLNAMPKMREKHAILNEIGVV